MLIIRPEQLDAFDDVAETAFERSVAAYVREQHGEESVVLASGTYALRQLDEETLLGLVRLGIARARSYGMTWESSIAAFVVLMFIVAPNFDEHPLIRRVLRADTFDPDSGFEEIWERTSAENWELARAYYEPDSWNTSGEEE